MKLQRKVPIVLVAAAALTVTGCAESDRESGSTDSAAATGDLKDTFTFGAAGAPELFDPLYAMDGETFRVTRQIHQDGEPFNAQAVCDNFTRMFEQKGAGQTAAEYWTYFFGGFSDKPADSLFKSCQAQDDHSFGTVPCHIRNCRWDPCSEHRTHLHVTSSLSRE